MAIYKRLHLWAHEINPYTNENHASFIEKRSPTLWKDMKKLKAFLERHFISIKGKGFYCTLWDSQDGKTKILALEKE